VGLVLAALNIITPVLAAMLNVLGSLFVVFNSARLVREGEEFEAFEDSDDESKPEEASEESGEVAAATA
jgi:Cd2+/Zn2+-exporting ATPase